jgi:hypothetical protein
MNRRANILIVTTLLGLAGAGIAQSSFARQSDPWLGTWQLNLTKSKYSPGPPPKSVTFDIQAEGQSHKLTAVGINAQGNPTSIVFTWIYDGVPHPATDNPNYDARAVTRVDAYTHVMSFTKAGKLVRVETNVVSRDGKTATATISGVDANGRQINNIQVYDKQ